MVPIRPSKYACFLTFGAILMVPINVHLWGPSKYACVHALGVILRVPINVALKIVFSHFGPILKIPINVHLWDGDPQNMHVF